jgi:hypothetical protein
MSNDMILSDLKNALANLPGGLDDDTKAVAGGNVGNNKRISIKGGVFRKYSGGKEVGTIEDRHMNVIFVKMAHNPSRTYYTGAYEEGVKIGPTCWSNDSKVPDPEVKNPQAASCDKCPWSVKGSGRDGKGSGCRLSWRTAVVLPHDPSGDVMQLVLPAASVFGKEEGGKWPFRAYVQMLAANNISAGRVITKMQFDTKSSAPRLQFSPAAAVSANILDTLQTQKDSPAAEAAVKLTVFQTDETVADEEVVPAAFAPPSAEAEPVLREAPKKSEPTAPAGDVADIVKKWAKK